MDSNEVQRLAALMQMEILDTAPEAEFDELVRLAAWICDVPMAAVSLVDENRQWCKARLGLPVAQTPRSDAFCAHTIGQRDVFEVADAPADPRFAANPLVLGEPHRAVVEQSSNVILLVDVGGVIQYVSPAARLVLGYEPAELVGSEARLVLDAPGGRDIVGRALGSELGDASAGVCRARDGERCVHPDR